MFRLDTSKRIENLDQVALVLVLVAQVVPSKPRPVQKHQRFAIEFVSNVIRRQKVGVDYGSTVT